MLIDLALISAGGVLLYFGAEWLVHGAAGLARTFGIRPLVIGLTIVAFGTSAPELVVSLVASFQGRSAIVLGNVVGSNIANLGLILAVTALIFPPRVDGTLIRREVPALLATTALVPLTSWNGRISRLEGVLMLTGGVAFTGLLLWSALRAPPAPREEVQVAQEVREEAARGSPSRLVLLSVIGLAALVAGGKFFVDGATGLALAIGMSERVVGLTIVAMGTSFPELATSIVAALRGHSSIAVGNVVGSNIYNVLITLGAAATARPVSVQPQAMFLDLAVLVGISLLGALMLRSARVISRVEGAGLLAIYFAFLITLAMAP